ncbi:uncharacterized protein ARMOST_19246 [Armillaria ostoyae]|uniref:Uncharacterized protein n=1 Tax=Armillaria ostoyae TaxID=47428 RepID=A0A284S402_ARMOS|nr:uncharacterized protein ARMOST_19246 [Armillaria ostoyae]
MSTANSNSLIMTYHLIFSTRSLYRVYEGPTRCLSIFYCISSVCFAVRAVAQRNHVDTSIATEPGRFLTLTFADALLNLLSPGKTWSQRVFSPWEGPVITVPDPSFDFEGLVRHRVEEEDALESLDAYDPFDSQSPLSTPPDMPTNSRPPSPFDAAIPVNQVPDAPTHTPQAVPASSRSHGKKQSRQNRKRKRQAQKEHDVFSLQELPRNLQLKHTHAAEPIVTEFDVANAPHASTGYVGKVEATWKREHTLEELVGPRYNFQHCHWQGHVATPIVDRQGRVISVLAGHPEDPDWDAVHKEGADTLENLRTQCRLSDDQRKHWRGHYGALSFRISYGSGQTHLQNLHHNDANTTVLLTLINCVAFLRLAGFGSSAFATWAPKTFAYYATHLKDLLVHDVSLILNWANSIFAATTFNFGLRTLCFRHTDSGNLPFGWCAITALGKFNHLHGGHLVL